MNDATWKKVSYYFGLLPIGVLFGLVAFIANIEIKDLDLWLHIATGRYIVQNHVIPHTDILSASFAGAPWINHEWLFQVIVYLLYNTFGSDGLLKMQVVLVVLTMLILLQLGDTKEKQLTTVFVLMLVFFVFSTRFTIRPELYSLLFFAIYIWVMALHIDKVWATWVLFFVQVLWSNLHGFFFFGPLFVTIAIASEWIKRHLMLPYEWNESGRLTDDEYGRLKWILVAVVAACFVNPYFVKGAMYPLDVLFSLSGQNQIFFNYIEELQKPITWQNMGDTHQFVFYKILILLSAVSFIFNRRRIDISALIFWLVFLIFSLNAARNIAFFAFAAYLVIITNLSNISFLNSDSEINEASAAASTDFDSSENSSDSSQTASSTSGSHNDQSNIQSATHHLIPLRFVERKFQYMTEIVAKLLLLMWLFDHSQMISGRSYYDFHKYEPKSEFGGISLRSFPQKAADFLVDNKVSGHFFNDFNSGAYLLGRTSPNIKVFIDGRTEFYGGEFFRQYQKIWQTGDPPTIASLFEKYKITGALLSSVKQHIPEDILKYFHTHKEWVCVYFDYDAVIFLKYTPQNKPVIDRNAIDLAKRKTVKEDLKKLGPERDLPYQYYYRAFTIESLGLREQALEEVNEALNIAPDYAEAYKLRGKIYAQKGDYGKAFENFRIAATFTPRNQEIRFNLAQAYFDLGDFEHAVNEYKIVDTLWPKTAKTYFLLAKTYAKTKQYDESLSYLKKGHEVEPKNVYDILNIGDIVLEQKEYARALEFYKLGFKTRSNLDQVHEKVGAVLEALGSLDQAQKAYKAAVSIDPNNKKAKEKLEKLTLQKPKIKG